MRSVCDREATRLGPPGFRIGRLLTALTWLTFALLGQGFGQGVPTLVGVTQLTQDSRADNWPALSFNSSGTAGILTWGKGVNGANHDDMYFSSWTGSGWSSPAFVPGQVGTARHQSFSVSFRPETSEALVTFGSSGFAVTVDEVRARTWEASTGWNPGPINVGDGVDDNDGNGTVRYALDGSYALSTWRDAVIWTSEPASGKSSLAASIWNPQAGTFGVVQTGVAAAPPFLNNLQRHDRSLAQDPTSGNWVVAFFHDDQSTSTPLGNVGYAVASFSGSDLSFSAPVMLNTSAINAKNPVVCFSDQGAGAMFWSEIGDGGDLELFAANWTGTGFTAGQSLTRNGVDDDVQCALPVSGGWLLVFTRRSPCDGDHEIFAALYDGAGLGSETQLTDDTFDQGNVQVAADGNGGIQLAWTATLTTQGSSREIFTAGLDLSGTGLPITPIGCGCSGSGGFVPALSATGAVVPGGQVLLSLDGGLGSATSLLLIGAGPGEYGMAGGCTLWLSQPLPATLAVPLGGSGQGQGTFSLPGTLPASLPAGATFSVQAFVLDSGVAQGFSNSNGVLFRVQ